MAANLASEPSLSGSAVSYSLDVVSLIRQINAMPDGDPTKIILRTALAHSIRPIWALMCRLAGLALITTIFIKHYDLNQKLATEQGFEGQEKRKMKETHGDPELAAPIALPQATGVDEKKIGDDVDTSESNASAAVMEETSDRAGGIGIDKMAESSR